MSFEIHPGRLPGTSHLGRGGGVCAESGGTAAALTGTATSESRASGSSRAQLIRLENALRQKVSERDKVVGLFRRGSIGTDALDKQLDEIASEETSLRLQIDDLAGKLRGIEAGDKNLASTEALLQELGRRLDEPISWDIKRQTD